MFFEGVGQNFPPISISLTCRMNCNPPAKSDDQGSDWHVCQEASSSNSTVSATRSLSHGDGARLWHTGSRRSALPASVRTGTAYSLPLSLVLTQSEGAPWTLRRTRVQAAKGTSNSPSGEDRCPFNWERPSWMPSSVPSNNSCQVLRLNRISHHCLRNKTADNWSLFISQFHWEGCSLRYLISIFQRSKISHHQTHFAMDTPWREDKTSSQCILATKRTIKYQCWEWGRRSLGERCPTLKMPLLPGGHCLGGVGEGDPGGRESRSAWLSCSPRVEETPRVSKSTGRKSWQWNLGDSLLTAETGNGHPRSGKHCVSRNTQLSH